MAGKTFRFELITPDRTVFNGEVASLSVPTGGGSIGVLPGHAPMVCTVDVGPVRIEDSAGNQSYFMVGDGFLEVQRGEVKLLAEVGERADQIDVARAEESERRALERLRERVKADTDFERARAALSRAMTRIKIARDLVPRQRRRP
jgi:F-type H+-transporting ATPase subunit epsilon